MNLSIDRLEFLEALNKAKAATEKKSALPVLNNFLLIAGKSELIVKATDLENYLTFLVRARIEREGKALVNADKLTNIIKSINSPEVQLSIKDDVLNIEGARSSFKLTNVDPEDFPEFPQVDVNAAILAYTFTKSIEKVEYAISKEDSRYALQGMYIHGSNGETHFVGSDGHRLALYMASSQIEHDLLIPRKSLRVLHTLLKDYLGEVEIGQDESFAHFKGEDWTLSVRLLEGEYPDYTSVIPKSFNYVALVDREELISSVKRLSAIAESSAFPVKLTFASNLLVLEISEPEYGEGKDEIDIDYSDEPIEIGFNGRYLLEALDSFETEKVFIKMIDPDSAVVIEAQDSQKDPYLSLIMPMRL